MMIWDFNEDEYQDGIVIEGKHLFLIFEAVRHVFNHSVFISPICSWKLT